MKRPYIPNSVSLSSRISLVIGSVSILAYGTYGLLVNHLEIPIRSRRWWRRRDLEFHDEPVVFAYAALICIVLVMLSVVADHYDRRDNEAAYHHFIMVGIRCAVMLMLFAMLLQIAVDLWKLFA